jgi:[acyl-carrier-protein] S-malonyltransferase
MMHQSVFFEQPRSDMKIAILLPGQGSQFTGMAKSLLVDFPYVKRYFEEANDLLGFDILNLCLNGPEEELSLTINAQPAILLNSFCAFQILRQEYDFKPFLLAGHSLGEISALCCSEAIAFEDAIRIVQKRGLLMQEASAVGAGAMIAINGLYIQEVQDVIDITGLQKSAVISNINSESQIVVSGEREAVNKVGSEAKGLGALIIPLKVSAPFHSPMMKPAAIAFEKELNCYHYSKLIYPVISNVTCKPYGSENEIVPLLVDQITSPVNWLKISSYMCRTGAEATLELPPGKTLTKFSATKKDKLAHFTFNQFRELFVNIK